MKWFLFLFFVCTFWGATAQFDAISPHWENVQFYQSKIDYLVTVKNRLITYQYGAIYISDTQGRHWHKTYTFPNSFQLTSISNDDGFIRVSGYHYLFTPAGSAPIRQDFKFYKIGHSGRPEADWEVYPDCQYNPTDWPNVQYLGAGTYVYFYNRCSSNYQDDFYHYRNEYVSGTVSQWPYEDNPIAHFLGKVDNKFCWNETGQIRCYPNAYPGVASDSMHYPREPAQVLSFNNVVYGFAKDAKKIFKRQLADTVWTVFDYPTNVVGDFYIHNQKMYYQTANRIFLVNLADMTLDGYVLDVDIAAEAFLWNDSIIIAESSCDGLLISRDHGQSYQWSITQGIPAWVTGASFQSDSIGINTARCFLKGQCLENIAPSLSPEWLTPVDQVHLGDTVLQFLDGQLQRSLDGGSTFVSLNNANISASKLSAQNNRLFIFSPDLAFSDDWGDSWEVIPEQTDNLLLDETGNAYFIANRHLHRYAINSGQDTLFNDFTVTRFGIHENNIWLSTNTHKIYFSEDQGSSWVESFPYSLKVLNIDQHANQLVLYCYTAQETARSFYSADLGKTWSQLGPLPFQHKLGILWLGELVQAGNGYGPKYGYQFQEDGYLYAYTGEQGLWRTRVDRLYRQSTAVDTTLYFCEGDAVDYLGFQFYTPGQKELRLSAANGCDSVVRFQINQWPDFEETLLVYAQAGDSVAGRQVFSDTLFSDYFYTVNACDSLLHYEVHIQGFSKRKKAPEKGAAFSLFPNPAHQALHLTSSNNTPVLGLKVYTLDMAEKQVSSFLSWQNDSTSIPISALEAGVYYLQIQTEEGWIYKKFVKI